MSIALAGGIVLTNFKGNSGPASCYYPAIVFNCRAYTFCTIQV